jgi:hypothetical protein
MPSPLLSVGSSLARIAASGMPSTRRWPQLAEDLAALYVLERSQAAVVEAGAADVQLECASAAEHRIAVACAAAVGVHFRLAETGGAVEASVEQLATARDALGLGSAEQRHRRDGGGAEAEQDEGAEPEGAVEHQRCLRKVSRLSRSVTVRPT